MSDYDDYYYEDDIAAAEAEMVRQEDEERGVLWGRPLDYDFFEYDGDSTPRGMSIHEDERHLIYSPGYW